jgi:hypothetical protein
MRDYGVWRQQFGATNCGNLADLNHDCLVDIRDYGIWRQHFGEGTPPSGPRAALLDERNGEPGWRLLAADDAGRAVPMIPEADGLGLLVGGLLGLGGLAGWRRWRPPGAR